MIRTLCRIYSAIRSIESIVQCLHVQYGGSMKTILQINSSLSSAQGESTRLADLYVKGLLALHPQARLIVRDLAKEPVPHLDAARFGAFLSKEENRTQAQKNVLDYSDRLID